MNMQAVAAQLENGIRQAFIAEKIGAHLINVKRGPRTLTAILRLYEPDVRTLARVGRMGQAIEARAGVSPVRIHSHAGVIYVEAPSPAAVPVYANGMTGQGLAVPLGMTTMGAIVGIDFGADSHLLAVAPTNGGKTTALRTVLYHLAQQMTPQEARFIVSTFKPADWQGVTGLAHAGGLIVDTGETVDMVEWLAGEMYRRTNQYRTTPRLFVVLDDLLNILSRAPELASTLAEIASLGRGAGIHLIVGTQRLGKAGTGDAAVSGNITARIVFRTVSAQDAALFTGRGDTGAEALGDQPGDALLITTPGGVERVAVALTTDSDLAGLPQGEGGRPWLTGGGTGAVRTPARTGTQAGIPPVEAENDANGAARTGILPLPYRPPTSDEMVTLAALYSRKGSKNRVLAAAYREGKTPKSLGWLNEALEKMGVSA